MLRIQQGTRRCRWQCVRAEWRYAAQGQGAVPEWGEEAEETSFGRLWLAQRPVPAQGDASSAQVVEELLRGGAALESRELKWEGLLALAKHPQVFLAVGQGMGWRAAQ